MERASPAELFDDPDRASSYDRRIRHLAPGYDVLQASIPCVMTTHLQAEAHILIAGAGTGEEVVQLGRTQSRWTFTAVDPSSEMLDRCRSKVEDAGLDARVDYVCDRVECLPTDLQFDAATALLVSHFLLDVTARHDFFRAIADRLVPQAPLVVADLFGDPSTAEFEQIMASWRACFVRAGASDEEAERTFDAVRRDIAFLPETELEQLVRDAGFTEWTRFHQSLLWGAWWTQRK